MTNKCTPRWNAAEYAANSAVQQSWAREIIGQLHLRGDEHILDIGCGDGKVTAEIAGAAPHGSVLGIDASAEMIAYAKAAFPKAKNPNLSFEICDAREAGELAPGTPFDVAFSNAALHWVEDHEAILRGVAAVLKPGGRLAVSCGGKGNAHDVFLALRPEMRLKRWCRYFRKMPMPYYFYAPENYERWLPKHGFKVQSVKLVPKDATYDGVDRFAIWLQTTWLPFVQRVPENLRDEFIAAVTQRYITKHPPDGAGKVHVHMVRLVIDAVRLSHDA